MFKNVEDFSGQGRGFCDVIHTACQKAAGRRPYEKTGRTEWRRGGVGKEKPAPLTPPRLLGTECQQKTSNVIKMQVFHGRLAAPWLSICLWLLQHLSSNPRTRVATGLSKIALTFSN